jgi:hypothetical protein
MKLIIPQTNFKLRTESDRVIIDTSMEELADRNLERNEVARRLNKSLRMVDVYRRLPGEARLRSELTPDRRVTIKESELVRWLNFLKTKEGRRLYNGRTSSLRPRKKRGSSLEGFGRELSGFTLT